MSAKKKTYTLAKIKIVFFIFFVVLGLLGVVFFFIIKSNKSTKSESQFIPNTRTKWSQSHIFGEVDKMRFPDISSPVYVSREGAEAFLDDEEIVYTFGLGDFQYVYPASILSFHHIVNDTIDGKPVAMTLCLLSASAFLYDRTVREEILSLGVAGTLYNGNLIMYDRNTNSSWLQLTGEAFEGWYMNSRLTSITPVETLKWKHVKHLNNTKILSPIRDMEFYKDFYNKFLKSQFGIQALKNKQPDTRLSPYTHGIGIEIQEEFRFYPFESISQKSPINETVGGWDILVTYDEDLEVSRIFKRSIAGATLTFEKNGDKIKDLETESEWSTKGEAVSGKLKGTRLLSPVYSDVYWFAWSAFFPKTTFYK